MSDLVYLEANGGARVSIRRSLLCESSSFFEKLFTFVKNGDPIIKLPGEKETLETIVDFLEDKIFSIAGHELAIYFMSTQFKIPMLKNLSVRFVLHLIVPHVDDRKNTPIVLPETEEALIKDIETGFISTVKRGREVHYNIYARGCSSVAAVKRKIYHHFGFK